MKISIGDTVSGICADKGIEITGVVSSIGKDSWHQRDAHLVKLRDSERYVGCVYLDQCKLIESVIEVEGESWTCSAFIEYLCDTLIPDLRESGSDATADDFEWCIKFMEN